MFYFFWHIKGKVKKINGLGSLSEFNLCKKILLMMNNCTEGTLKNLKIERFFLKIF